VYVLHVLKSGNGTHRPFAAQQRFRPVRELLSLSRRTRSVCLRDPMPKDLADALVSSPSSMQASSAAGDSVSLSVVMGSWDEVLTQGLGNRVGPIPAAQFRLRLLHVRPHRLFT
jgi:hypothetical protein